MSLVLEALAVKLILGREVDPTARFSQEELSLLVSSLASLSTKYVSRTGSAPRITPEEADAYTLYYLPINASKVQHILGLLPELKDQKTLRILDYGCGPGTASLSIAATTSLPLDISLIDSEPLMLERAEKLFASLKRPHTAFHSARTLPSSSTGVFDVIFACNVFNELPAKDHSLLYDELQKKSAPGGTLIIMEPGSREATRDLMRLRDHAATGTRSILYPCTHSVQCPLLQDESQWCHASILFERSTLMRQLDELTGFNKHRIKFSALVVGDHPVRDGFRLITPAKKNKVGSSALICGEDFFGTALLQKRDRTDGNRLFEKADQHDLLTITPSPLTARIGKDTRVKQKAG